MKKFSIIILILFGGLAIFFIGQNTEADLEGKSFTHTPVRANKRITKTIPELKLPSIEFVMPAVDAVDELTAKIVGLTEQDTMKRNDLVWSLRDKNLNEQDFKAFYAFLLSTPEQEGPQLSYHSLKNDLLTFVIDDGRFKESTAKLMLEIMRDTTQHEVMKEYTIQYVPDYFEKHWINVSGAIRKEKENLSEVEKSLQVAFVNTMWNMLEEKSGPIPGTALIRLHELSETFSIIDQKELQRSTEEMIQDLSMPVSSRMAALNVASERKFSQVFSIAERLLFDDQNPTMLRMAALNTAFKLAPDERFSEQIKISFIENEESNKRLKRAATIILTESLKNRG